MARPPLCNCVLLVALVCPAGHGQVAPPQGNHADVSAAKTDDASSLGGVDILSDTGGVDLRPYMKEILGSIRRNWISLIPPEAKPPESKQGEAQIRFTIAPDGKITAMHLDGSAQDDGINRSCWGAITSMGQFPALPAAMGTKPLELRIHFYVNTHPQ
jgi:TonB family protein